MSTSRSTSPTNTAASASSRYVPPPIINGAEDPHLSRSQTSGVYSATLDPTYHGLLDADLVDSGKREVFRIPREAVQKGISFPYITFVSLPFYHDRRQLSKVTCCQITETKLYFVWDAMYKPDSIDFFRQLGMIGGNTPPLPPPPGGDNSDLDTDDGSDLFTTEATVAAAQAASAQASDDDWDTQGVAESQALIASGSGSHTQDTESTGPSTAGAVVDANGDDDTDDNDNDDDLDDDDHNLWEDEDPELDGDDLPVLQNPLVGLGRSGKSSIIHVSKAKDLTVFLCSENVVSTGPIVFCIDFSPQ